MSSTAGVASPGPSSKVRAIRRRQRDPRSTHLGMEDRALLVELEHADRALRRGLDAQLAEHAFVEVLVDDLERVLFGDGVDVDGADLGELGRHLRVRRDGVVDLNCDEQRLGLGHQTAAFSCILDRRMSGISAMSSATVMPASASRAIFSVAVSSLPSTIVPACPKDMPGISSMN